jgi:hypothetical protein
MDVRIPLLSDDHADLLYIVVIVVLILRCVFFLLRGWDWAVVSLALICSFAKMRSHLGLDATVKEDSVPETTVLAVAKVLRCSAALLVSEDGKRKF